MNEADLKYQELLEEYDGHIDINTDTKTQEHPSETFQKMTKMGILDRLSAEIEQTRARNVKKEKSSAEK